MKNKTMMVLTVCGLFVFLQFNSFSQSISVSNSVYPDSVKNEWWYPFVKELAIEPKDYQEFRFIFINGELMQCNDSLKLYKEGIAIADNSKNFNVQNDFVVYYFKEFMIGSVDFEFTFEKMEKWKFNVQGNLELIQTDVSDDGYYSKMYSDKAMNVINMLEIKK